MGESELQQLRRTEPSQEAPESDPWVQMYEWILELPSNSRKWAAELPQQIRHCIAALAQAIATTLLQTLADIYENLLQRMQEARDFLDGCRAAAPEMLQAVKAVLSRKPDAGQVWTYGQTAYETFLEQLMEQILAAEPSVMGAVVSIFSIGFIACIYFARVLFRSSLPRAAAEPEQPQAALPQPSAPTFENPASPQSIFYHNIALDADARDDTCIVATNRLRRRELQEQRTLQALKDIGNIAPTAGPKKVSIAADDEKVEPENVPFAAIRTPPPILLSGRRRPPPLTFLGIDDDENENAAKQLAPGEKCSPEKTSEPVLATVSDEPEAKPCRKQGVSNTLTLLCLSLVGLLCLLCFQYLTYLKQRQQDSDGIVEQMQTLLMSWQAAGIDVLAKIKINLHVSQTRVRETLMGLTASVQPYMRSMFASLHTERCFQQLRALCGKTGQTAMQALAEPSNRITMAGAGVVLGACVLKLRRGWATQQIDVDGGEGMVVKSPVGAAVVMGLSVSQHMMTSVSNNDEGGIFAPGGFAI